MIIMKRKTGGPREVIAKYTVKSLTTFRLETFDERDVIVSIMRGKDYVGSLTKKNPIFETNVEGRYVFQSKTGFSAFIVHAFSPVSGDSSGGGDSSGSGGSDCDCEELKRRIDTKADITYVDAGLADKADITYVDAGLADKADITYVDAGLADKADITYVDARFSSVICENLLINGGFDFWDYGTSQTSTGIKSSNRWNHQHTGGTTKTHSRRDHPAGASIKRQYSQTIVASGNTADSSCVMSQYIENVQATAGKKVSISIRVKATAPSISIGLSQIFGVNGNPSPVNYFFAQKLDVDNNFAIYTIPNIQVPDITGKVLGTGGRDCLRVAIYFDAGSDYNDEAGYLGNQSGTFDIDWIKVEIGETVTDYAQPDMSLEKTRCGRYYQCNTSPGGRVIARWYPGELNTFFLYKEFFTPMRITPTVSINIVYSTNCTFTLVTTAPDGMVLELTPSTATLLCLFSCDWKVNAEI